MRYLGITDQEVYSILQNEIWKVRNWHKYVSLYKKYTVLDTEIKPGLNTEAG
jgi:hypothetical protein